MVSLLAKEVACSIGAAAGGAAAVLGGGGGERIRDEDAEALVMFLMAAMVSGILLVFVVVQGVRIFRRHVLKIPDKPESFVMDKKVKCKSGEKNYFLFLTFTVPSLCVYSRSQHDGFPRSSEYF